MIPKQGVENSFRRPSYTTAIKTGEAAILFPRQEPAWGTGICREQPNAAIATPKAADKAKCA